MSFFHRRTRSASAQRGQHSQPPVSSPASVAAAQAFLANRMSQPNLSASAAAQALRTMSPTPTPVHQVQTKRMIQRQSSNSSAGSAQRGRGRGGLVRQNSAGSMTERTFRSPSPGRAPTPSDPVAPPVPSFPDNFTKPPPIPAKSQRRSASLETPPRTLPPPVARPAGHGRPPATVDPQQLQKAAAVRSVKLHPPHEIERSDSRNSINFSYPRPSSPLSQSHDAQNGITPLQNRLRNGIGPAEAEGFQHSVANVADQPIKKKKKKSVPGSSEGSHFQGGSMDSRPITRQLEPSPDLPPQTPEQPKPMKKKKEAVVVTGESSHFPTTPSPARSHAEADPSAEQIKRTQRASGALLKQPSVVREDWEGEQEQAYSPATESQQREEQGLSPVNSPAAILQGKRSSTEANMSRKMEDPAVALKPIAQPVHHAVTQDPVESGEVKSSLLFATDDQAVRPVSISPSRSTRFSDRLSSDLSSGRKHEPLPRSVSPAKSALKHHSSQNASPVDPHLSRQRGSSATPSEASDSNLSADGTVRRKKSARVSFETEPLIVGTAAETIATDSPVFASPQSKEQMKKGWFGLNRTKPARNSIPSEDDLAEGMKPRPQLPSFGSVRGKSRRDGSEANDFEQAKSAGLQPGSAHQAVTSSITSSATSSSSNIQLVNQAVSSDHAIGGVLAQEAEHKVTGSGIYASKLPLPPQVTSVEGSGYVSDTESESSTDANRAANAPEVATQSSQSTHAPATASNVVPSLSVQPPTPGLEQGAPSDQWLVEVPGGFPESTEELAKAVGPAPSKPSTGLGIADDSPAATIAASPSVPAEAQQQSESEESEESDVDNASIYSDAAEDLSDLEGDGFGSINAIVESPMIQMSTNEIATPPDSPLVRTTQDRPQQPTRNTSWDAAQARWSGIAQQTRQVGAEAATVPTNQQAAPSQQKRQKKTVSVAPPPPAPPPSSVPRQPVSPQKTANLSSPYPPLSSEKPSQAPVQGGFKQSMRSSPPSQRNTGPVTSQGGFRQSMRSQPGSQRQSVQTPTQGGFKQSMRAQPAIQNTPGFRSSMRAGAEPSRPQSLATGSQPRATAPPAQPRAALQKKHIPPATSAPKAAPAPRPVAPAIVDDSDSESSFRKRRKNKAASGGRYNMRQSMRAAGPVSTAPPSQPAGRGGVRSLSPVARRPFSPVEGQRPMKMSMRTSMDAPAPTLRNQPEQKRSSSLFGKSRKAKSPPRAAPLPLTTQIRSRFADSDDEDDPQPSTFRSRFQDSSDDEPEPARFRPVRGIPKKSDEGDSTDLADSSDEDKKPPRPKSQPPLTINTSIAPSDSGASPPVSPTTAKKRGLFSRLRGKKDRDDQANSRPGFGTIAERNEMSGSTVPAMDAAKGGKTSLALEKNQGADALPTKSLGFSSTAERDALIAQTMAKLEAAKSATRQIPGSPPATSPPGSPTPGKLQRRVTPQRIMSDTWPLPPKLSSTAEERPSTSDAVPMLKQTNGSPLRPGVGDRITSSSTVRTEGGTVVYGRTGKRKRFALLRKAFGLKD